MPEDTAYLLDIRIFVFNKKVLMDVHRGDKGDRYLILTNIDSQANKDIAYEVPRMINKRCYTPFESKVEEEQVHQIRN